jgi:hypothetical protein
MEEVTVPVAARRRAAFIELLQRHLLGSEAASVLVAVDGEKLVDGQAVLALQRADPDDGRSRAVGMVSGRILARAGSSLKPMVAGELGCGRYGSERTRLHGMDWCRRQPFRLFVEAILAICEGVPLEGCGRETAAPCASAGNREK